MGRVQNAIDFMPNKNNPTNQNPTNPAAIALVESGLSMTGGRLAGSGRRDHDLAVLVFPVEFGFAAGVGVADVAGVVELGVEDVERGVEFVAVPRGAAAGAAEVLVQQAFLAIVVEVVGNQQEGAVDHEPLCRGIPRQVHVPRRFAYPFEQFSCPSSHQS